MSAHTNGKWWVKFCAALIVSLTAATASAQTSTDKGRFWVDICASQSLPKQYQCAALLIGLGHGYNEGLIENDIDVPFCFPAGITVAQIKDTFNVYLKENPELLHLNVAELYANSMKEAYPCE